MEKRCWNCGNFRPYYEKGFCEFTKTDHGFCTKQLLPTKKHNGCEFYRTRPRPYPVKNAVILRRLEETLVNIAAIKEILEEKP